MPIYEFYCADCHRIFNFLARSPGIRRRPDCPRCGRKRLERRPSSFAVTRGGAAESAGPGDESGPLPDEARLGAAMEQLAREAESLDEDDPKQGARMIRRLYDAAGLPVGRGVEEALTRIEAGEDPEAVEAQLGEALEGDDEPTARSRQLRARARRPVAPPQVDPELYEL